jgi:hypothetical protein
MAYQEATEAPEKSLSDQTCSGPQSLSGRPNHWRWIAVLLSVLIGISYINISQLDEATLRFADITHWRLSVEKQAQWILKNYPLIGEKCHSFMLGMTSN